MYNSVISLNGNFKFIAIVGAGLGIYGNSYVMVHEGTNVSLNFINNVARRRGGAIYVEKLYTVPSILAYKCIFNT